MKAKSKLLVVLALILTFALILNACSEKKDATSSEITTENTGESVPPIPEDSSPENAPINLPPESEVKLVNIMAMTGPTGIGMAVLDRRVASGDVTFNYNIAFEPSPDVVISKIISGEVDIASVPVNLAANIFNKTNGEIVFGGVNTLGVLYIVTGDSDVKSLNDLKGKEIFSIGQGATPEYVLKYLLSQNNIDPDKDVTITFESDNAAVQTKLLENPTAIALLPEPFVTTLISKNESIKSVIDMTAEWEKATNGLVLTTGGIIARKAFVDENPGSFDAFLDFYADATKLANDTEFSAQIAVDYGLVPSVEIAKIAIPRCNMVFIRNEEMLTAVSKYLEVLVGFNPESVGGVLPNESFFYQSKVTQTS